MKKTFHLMFMLVAAVLLLASCSKGPSKATRLIPENAFVVVRVDVKQLVEKSGLNSDSKLIKKLKSGMGDTEMSEEMTEKIVSILLNPSSSGIDFDQPVFFYFTGNRENMGGLVGCVSSKSKLTDLLNQISDEVGESLEIEEEDGVSRIEDNFFFTDDWFFIGDANGSDFAETLKEMAESGEGSLSDSESMEKLCEQEGVMSLMMLGSGIKSVDDRDVKQALSMLREQMPDGVELDDLGFIGDFQLMGGEALLTSELLAMSEDAKEWVGKYEDALKDIDSDLMKYVSSDGLSLFVNMDMNYLKKSVEQFMKAQHITDGEAKEMVDNVMSSMTGSFALDISSFTQQGPNVNGFIGTKDNTIVDLLQGALGEQDLQERGDGFRAVADYSYDWDSYDPTTDDYVRTPKSYVDFGRKSGITYLCYGENPNGFQPASHAVSSGDIRGKGMYVRFNFNFLKKFDEDMVGSEVAGIMKDVAKMFNYCESYYEGNGRSVFRLTTQDDDKNPLELILDYVSKFI